MKTHLSFALLVLMTSLFLGCNLRPPFAGLKWGETSKSITAYSSSKLVSVVYDFKNEGPNTVQIDTVNPSCTCITGSASTKIVPSGQGGQIRVEYRPRGHLGSENAAILVIIHSGQKKSVQSLNLHVDIKPEFQLDPSPVIWTKGEPANGKVVHITASRPGESPPSIIDVKGGGPNFKVLTTASPTSAGKAESLMITPVSTAKPMHQLIRISLRTSKNETQQTMIFALIQPS